MARFYDFFPQVLSQDEPFAIGIISGVKGSSPQKEGAKALFFADGRIQGTMGGGCLEAEIQDRARRALVTGQACTFELILDHDFGWDDGLICGGKVSGVILPQAAQAREIWEKLVRVEAPMTWGVKKDFSIAWVGGNDAEEWLYQEEVKPPVALWIAGSGHVAQAVAPLAIHLDFEPTIYDDRPSLANTHFFPATTRFRVDAWEELVSDSLPSRPAFGLILTRGHQHDAWVLRHWIHKPFVFLGMIGSRRKFRLISSEFLEQGIASEDQLGRIASPVGLAIESQTVPEIAVSIMAQLIQKRAEHFRGASVAVKATRGVLA